MNTFEIQCLQRALGDIENHLLTLGFKGDEAVAWKGSEIKRSFVRSPVSWRVECVEVIYTSPTKKSAARGIRLDFGVAVIRSDGAATIFDVMNVAFLSGRGEEWYRLPKSRVLAAFNTENLGSVIVSDVGKTLGWFEQYGSPEGCLQRLEQGNTLVGPIHDRGIAKDVFDSLRLIADRK